MNNTHTPDTMSDLEYYNAALARFEAQPIGRAKLYLQSTLDGLQRADLQPDSSPYVRAYWGETRAGLRDLLKFGTFPQVTEFAAWVEATIKCDTACNVPVYIADEVRREGAWARKEADAEHGAAVARGHALPYIKPTNQPQA